MKGIIILLVAMCLNIAFSLANQGSPFVFVNHILIGFIAAFIIVMLIDLMKTNESNTG